MSYKHGHFVGNTPSPEYQCWDAMIGRCYRPSNASYARYGARGVGVCERWRNSFEMFLADMGSRPSLDHQIERKDRTRGYEPENCVWATRKEQARNRISNLILSHAGETLPAVVWSERLGLPATTIQKRKERGWSDEEALTRPRRAYETGRKIAS